MSAAELVSALAAAKPHVPDVPDVESLPDKASSGTAGGTADVPDVPERHARRELPQASVPEDERPCFKVFDVSTELDQGGKLRPGVWFFGAKAEKDGTVKLTKTWVCGPLHIDAQTADANDASYGRMLRFRTSRGTWRTWACPMEFLRGSGEELRGELLDMGLLIDPNSRHLLNNYLCAIPPKKRVRCAAQTGWCGDAFVLPGDVLGRDADNVIYQGARDAGDFGTAGTLEDWQRHISALAVGNPLLMLALSTAFAGPLLQRCHAESGGVHLVGDSSCGKTTTLEAAVSVWGAPSYRRSWRATANGLEGAAALHNDSLLALDEISECDPREVGAVVYMAANGRGKQRASRSGHARPVAAWRCVLLSTGERTIGATMADAGKRQMAGQGVRLLDIPVPGRAHGVFDDLHGFASGRELSDHLKAAAARYYGTAIRAFLERYAADDDDMAASLDNARKLILTDDMDGQEKRAAGRFALFAMAGELATHYDVTAWPEGAATQAARDCFDAWRKLRGKGRDERRQVVDALTQFLERHGDGRFSEAGQNHLIRDRAGWWQRDPARGRVYLFNSDGLREALRGFDFRRALDALEHCGAIPKASASGERAQPMSIDGRKVRVYSVSVDSLGAASEHI